MEVGLKNLRAFVAVAEAGSFTRAAERLRLAQPTVTVAVQNLEARLGLTLIDRTSREMHLTPDGATFLETARRILRDFSEAIGGFRDAGRRRRGRVRVALVPGLARHVVGPVVAAFSARFPDVPLELRDDNTRGVVARVLSGGADFGFCSFAGHDPDLQSRIVARDIYGIVCLAGSRMARCRAPRWGDLASEPFVAFTDDTGPATSLHRLEHLPPELLRTHIEVANTTAAEAILEAGLGITALPALGAPPGRARRLVFRPLTDPVVRRDISLVRRRDRSLSPPARQLADAFTAAIVEAAERVGQSVEHHAKPARRRST